MNINSAIHLTSLVVNSNLPENNFPIYAFIGRSNVGKSSLINSLTNQKELARTSSKPGKTQTINLFLINKKTYFADLPGYGYAKLSKAERKNLQNIIFWFFNNPNLSIKQIFILIDGKIGPTKDDNEFIEFIHSKNLPFSIILTKIDKLKRNQLNQQISNLKNQFWGHNILPYSSFTHEGKKELLNHIII